MRGGIPARLVDGTLELLRAVPHGNNKAIAAAVGVHPVTLSRWRSGFQVPRPDLLMRLLQHWGVNPADVLDERSRAAIRERVAAWSCTVTLTREQYHAWRQEPITGRIGHRVYKAIAAQLPPSWTYDARVERIRRERERRRA